MRSIRVKPSCVFLLLMSAVLSILSPGVRPVSAQSAGKIVINQVDTSAFPQIKIAFAVQDGSGNPVTDLANGISVLEDGVKVPFDAAKDNDRVGNLLSAIIDASRFLGTKPGATGKLRLDETKEAITELTCNQKTRPAGLCQGSWVDEKSSKDLVQVSAILADGQVNTVVDFTSQYATIYNNVYLFNTIAQGETALFDPLLKAVDGLTNDPSRAAMSKSLLVFSDGIDNLSALQIENVAGHANAVNVSINTVFLGTEEGPASARNLKALSQLTHGIYAWYRGTESLKPFFQRFAAQGNQKLATYHSKANVSGKHLLTVRVEGPNLPSLSQDMEFATDIQSPAVQVELASAASLQRNGAKWNTPLELTEPRTYSVNVKIAWPDQHPRAIQTLDLILDGKPVTSEVSPQLDNLKFDISTLGAGQHSVQVKATDELGRDGTSAAANLLITLHFPDQPTEIKATNFALTYAGLGALAVALGALALAVYAYFRVPMVKGATQAFVGKVKEATAPFVRRRGGSAKPRESLAYLLVKQGSTAYEGPIDLRGVMKIGRDSDLAKIVLPEKTVSRLHATIEEVQDGVFYIKDEGGSTGVYINDDESPLPNMGEYRLKDNDEIALGEVTLQFKQRKANGSADTDEHPPSAAKSTTEPFRPRDKKKLDDNRDGN